MQGTGPPPAGRGVRGSGFGKLSVPSGFRLSSSNAAKPLHQTRSLSFRPHFSVPRDALHTGRAVSTPGSLLISKGSAQPLRCGCREWGFWPCRPSRGWTGDPGLEDRWGAAGLWVTAAAPQDQGQGVLSIPGVLGQRAGPGACSWLCSHCLEFPQRHAEPWLDVQMLG